MLKNRTRTTLVLGIWFAAAIVVLAWSLVAGASRLTTALLLMTCAAPMGVALLLGFGGGRSMTTHELLYAVNNEKDDRS